MCYYFRNPLVSIPLLKTSITISPRGTGFPSIHGQRLAAHVRNRRGEGTSGRRTAPSGRRCP